MRKEIPKENRYISTIAEKDLIKLRVVLLYLHNLSLLLSNGTVSGSVYLRFV